MIVFVGFSLFIFYWGSSHTMDAANYAIISEHTVDVKPIPSDTITLATYNIGYLSGMTNNLPVERSRRFVSNNEDIIVSLLKSLNVDILAMQEIDFNANRSFDVDQLKTIAERVGFGYSARAVNWDMNYVPFPYWPIDKQFGKIVSGQAIASKYPIFKNRIVTLAKPLNAPFWYTQFYLDRLVQVCEINVGQPLYVLNLHLEAFDTETREVQAHAVVELVKTYIENFPVILTGDFNSQIPFEVGETTMRTIVSELGFNEAIPDSIQAENRPSGTFPSDKPTQKIDHVFYHPDQVQPISWSIPDSLVEASDHRPMVFKFKLKAKL